MRIFVKVKSNSKENKVIPPTKRLLQTTDMQDYFTVYVKEPPIKGKANDAVLRTLAEYFKVGRSDVRLVSGATSKTKVFEIK